MFFHREDDQERARRHRRADAVRTQLKALGTDACQLAEELVDLAWQDAAEDEDALMRRIGWEVLVANGRSDLWQLAYLQFNEGNLYVLGDEVRFLLNQPRANPTPLREDTTGDVDAN